jgi:Glycosyl hydrolases family 2, TIM barrel domain
VTKTLKLNSTVHSPAGKRLPLMTVLLLVCICAWFTTINVGHAAAEEGIAASGTTGAQPVQIRRQGDRFLLYRGAEPYYIKGVGGDRFLKSAADAGANSVRTWGSQNAAAILERARSNGMTVLLGIWLSHKADSYLSADYKRHKIAEVQTVLAQCKDHPALLMWSVGNEINLDGADTPEAWRFVNELARLIKAQDPNHPVISVVSFSSKVFDNIAHYAPDLDAVGINAYGALPKVRATIERSAYNGPYLITEWGSNGHWEVKQTSWGSPIEPTSAEKAELFRRRYVQDILANQDRCLGSYVFLWGQKEERTPTWYSMFIEEIPGVTLQKASCPQVDVMGYNWTGRWPANRAPEVTAMTINGRAANGGITLAPGEQLVAAVAAHDPDADHLNFVWELLQKPSGLSTGGGYEPRPERIGQVAQGSRPLLSLAAPETPGVYRLFVYVLDENGHVGTANIPFQVTNYQAHKETMTPPVPTPQS